MKTGARWAVGVLAGVLLVCILSGTWFFGSRSGQSVRQFGVGLAGLIANARSLEKIEKASTFVPPASGEVTGERLVAYIAVCEAVKPVADRYGAWMRAHGGQRHKQGDFREAGEVVTLIGEFMKAFAGALEGQSMDTREWAWIGQAMRRAGLGAAHKGVSELDRALLEALEEAASKPGLSTGDREALQLKVEGFRKEFDARALPPTPNEALYLKHAKELEACALGEDARDLTAGFGASGEPAAMAP